MVLRIQEAKLALRLASAFTGNHFKIKLRGIEMNKIKPSTKRISTFSITILMIITQGCATSISRLSADRSTDETIFPDIKKDAWIKQGIYPNLDNLRSVATGMTKDQLYALLGHPHFKEGFGKVREWDYILNFRSNDGKVSETCQYKIIYSTNMTLQNTFWKPETCSSWLKPQMSQVQSPSVIEPIIEKHQVRTQVINVQLSADGMFDFDKYTIADLRPGGVEKLNRLIENIYSNGEIVQLRIVGHTDRLGEDAYNLKLSESRADTIRQFLIGKGISSEHISVTGAGKSMPIVECRQNIRNDALIRCLEPNRRFEIEAWTTAERKLGNF